MNCTRKALLLSLLLHAGALGLIFILLRVSKHIVLPNAEFATNRQILIDVSSGSGPAQASHSNASRVFAPKVKIQDLGIKFGFEVHATNKGQGSDSTGTSNGQAQQELKDDKELPLYRYVYDRINGNLSYPVELIAKKMKGNVSGVLNFSARGEFQEEKSRFNADSSFLKVAVVRAIRHAFRENIPSQIVGHGGGFEVSCQFVFEIVEHQDETLIAARQGMMGKKLSFYRSFEQSVLEWQLGPLSGLGPFASLDVTWFPRIIGDAFSKKAKIDPLDNYRDDAAW
jgi:hypothetical protein